MSEAKASKDEIQTLRDRELERAKAQAAKITEQAKREAYTLLAELDKLRKEKDKTKDATELARRARAAVKRGIEAIDAASDPVVEYIDIGGDYQLPRPLKVGDSVIITDIGKEAKVLSLPDKSDHVEVQAGSLKTRVKLQGLRLVEQPQKSKAITPVRGRTGVESRMTLEANTRLDLRGMSVDECLIELERFIDASLRTGLSEFTIVHGKGTGALRKAVQKYLKDSPYVKSHRLGGYGEGADGVSIVELK